MMPLPGKPENRGRGQSECYRTTKTLDTSRSAYDVLQSGFSSCVCHDLCVRHDACPGEFFHRVGGPRARDDGEAAGVAGSSSGADGGDCTAGACGFCATVYVCAHDDVEL